MWNVSKRDIERDILPMCRDEGMGICAWGTLGQGMFQTATSFAEREKSNPGRKGLPITAEEKAGSAVLETIAKRKGASIQNVALAYCMAKAPYVFSIVGSRKVEHLKGNTDGLGLRLSEEDIDEIEKGYEFDPGFPHTFLSGSMFTSDSLKGAFQAKDVWMTKFQGNFDWIEVGKAIQPAEE
jgi:aryl-alcohol dehydrogenase-like predicted oxidoreductase